MLSRQAGNVRTTLFELIQFFFAVAYLWSVAGSTISAFRLLSLSNSGGQSLYIARGTLQWRVSFSAYACKLTDHDRYDHKKPSARLRDLRRFKCVCEKRMLSWITGRPQCLRSARSLGLFAFSRPQNAQILGRLQAIAEYRPGSMKKKVFQFVCPIH